MKRKWIVSGLIALLLLVALLSFDRQSLLASINQVPIWLILLLLGLQIFSQLLINYQWYQITKMINISLSFWNIFQVNCQGAVMEAITPGVKVGGEITRAWQISRIAKCSKKQGAAVVAIQKLFSLSALLIILLVVVAYLTREGIWIFTRNMQVLSYSILLLFLLLFFSIFLFSDQLSTLLSAKKFARFFGLDKVQQFLLVLLEYVGYLSKSKNQLVALFLLSLFIWILYPIKMYFLAIQFYPEVQFADLSAITFAAYMVAMIPIFPGGLGGFEGSMSSLLFKLGFLMNDAIVITIFFRFSTFWFVLLFSLLFVILARISKNKTI